MKVPTRKREVLHRIQNVKQEPILSDNTGSSNHSKILLIPKSYWELILPTFNVKFQSRNISWKFTPVSMTSILVRIITTYLNKNFNKNYLVTKRYQSSFFFFIIVFFFVETKLSQEYKLRKEN